MFDALARLLVFDLAGLSPDTPLGAACRTGRRSRAGSPDLPVMAMSDSKPKMIFHVESARIVDSDESDRRLELLHDNAKKFGTVFNTVAPGARLSGVLRRRWASPWRPFSNPC